MCGRDAAGKADGGGKRLPLEGKVHCDINDG